MNPQYFIAALPTLPWAFYEKLEKLYSLTCYPEFRLPFHVTLFYFGELSDIQKIRVNEWLDDNKRIAKINAKIKGIDCFKKDKPFVYFFELESPELKQINSELNIFSDIHKDTFEFTPHLSLFFPQLELNEEDSKLLKNVFSEIETIEFNNIYLGSVINNITRIHKSISCI